MRLLPAPPSRVGRLVVIWAPFRKVAFGSDAARAATLAEVELRLPSGNAVMSGCASHDPLSP